MDHAVAVMSSDGVGALTVARRLGMRPPSLYKYFPSLHALYDALFARGVHDSSAAVTAAIADLPPGMDRLRTAGRAYVRWAVANPSLAQLVHWRVVPGFEPTPGTFAVAEAAQDQLRGGLRAAVVAGDLRPEAASTAGERLWTVLLSGVTTQQMANQPGAPFEDGAFTSFTDQALDLFRQRYAPRPPPGARTRPATSGGTQ